LPATDPLRVLFLVDRDGRKEAAINLLLHHGVRTCFEYAHSGDIVKAKVLSNAQLAPHVSLSIWVAMVTRSCALLLTDSKSNSFVSRDRLNEAPARMADRCATASCIERRCGKPARLQNSNAKSSKATSG
jgi:hypothetical protein